MSAQKISKPKAEPASVLVVDDHPIVRQGLAQALRRSREFKVCGLAADAEGCWRALESERPRLLLLDLSLGGALAFDLIRRARRAYPELGILVISMQNEAFFAQQAMDAGADGYIVKEEATARILHALRRVRERKTYISFPVMKKMLYQYAEDGKGKDPVRKLSAREFQVFRMLGEGRSTRDIAKELAVGVKTVETYCARMKQKLELQSAKELLKHALGWQPRL